MEQVIIAQFFVKPECIDKFKAETVGLIKGTRSESGCLFYELYQSIESPTDFIFYEKFKDSESFNFHLKTEHYLSFSAVLNSLQSKEAIVKIIA